MMMSSKKEKDFKVHLLDDSEHHYKGHRERLRYRFCEAGSQALLDYELLELILFRTIPRRDVKPLAKLLLKTFGSFAEVLTATPQRLGEISGVGDALIVDLKIIEAAGQRIAKGEIMDRPLLSSWSAVLDYCRTVMAFADKEQFRILFLDHREMLIRDEVQQVGTINHTPVYPREIIKRALEVSASYLILVHNHPSGDPTPSGADIRMTREIIAISKPLGIEVSDHIIIGRNGHASFRGLSLL
jgi:DNA repair protein RadC